MRKVLLASLAVAGLGLSTVTVSAAQLIVGVSWNNFQEERWKTDEAAIKAALEKGGAQYISADAQSSAEKQASDIESLVSKGAKVLIVLAQDSEAVQPAVQKALDEGVAVIGYDRLIENPKALYITFDNKKVGELEAAPVFKLKPKGNYLFIKGNSADPNADFVFSGQMDVVGKALKSGAIKDVGQTYTDNWDPANAQKETEQFLTKNNNKVDAVLSENDGMAGGVVAALTAQGLAGQVPVSGQDGDKAALNRVALGSQTVSVWKDSRELGKSAGEAALQLGKGTKLDKIKGVVKFGNGPKKVEMTSILLTPQPITKDNLNVVIDAKWISKDEVCKGVKAGSVKACG